MIEAARVRTLRSDDGVALAVHGFGDPAGPPVVLVPGTFSNATFWLGTQGTGLARTLGAAHYNTWTLDPRGHGRSQRQDHAGRWDFDDWARHDIPAAVRTAATANRAILIGHSAGGAAALAAAAADPGVRAHLRAIVVIATPLPWLQSARRWFSRAVRAAAARIDTFPGRLLRLGPEDEPAGVLEQWMRWNLEGRWVGDDGTDYCRCLAGLDLPVLALAGAGDRLWAPPAACRGLYDSIGSPDKTFLLCGRDSGFSRNFGHADIVVGRSARAEVWPLLMNWLAHVR